MDKIEKLTPEQEALIPVVRDEWMKVGLSTEPMNFEEAKRGISMAYKAAGRPVPSRWSISASPKEGSARGGTSGIFFGSHEAGWLAFYDFFGRIGVKGPERLAGLMLAARNAGWAWLGEDEVIISDRPEELHIDEQGRLHSDTGPAIKYRDGFALYVVHGVRVPEDVILNPSSLTVERVQQERNAEIRRVMMDRYGLSRFLLDSGAKKVHADDWGTVYRTEVPNDEPLVMVKVVNSTAEPDGTFKDYFLRIHPECRPLLQNGQTGQPQEVTGRNAVASTFGLRGEEYHPEIQT